MAKNDELYVIECNLRASRSMPFVSKVFDVNFIRVATQYIMNGRENINDNIFNNNEGLMITKSYGRYWEKNRVGVKVPQFSFNRLANADNRLGVEMLSTGEVACFGNNYHDAYLKALAATWFNIKNKCNVLISIGSDAYRNELESSIRLLVNNGFKLYGTKGTSIYFNKLKTKKELLLNKF